MGVSKSKETLAASRELRPPRVPLYVPVFTDPSLGGDLWCINVSVAGMALFAPDVSPGLRHGDTLEVEIALPDVGRVRASTRVVWVDARPHKSGDPRGTLTCGVAFAQMVPEDRGRLSRFILEYRPHVVVLGARPDDYATCVAALSPDVPLHRADTAEELERLIARGDVHVILAYGDDAVRVTRTVATAFRGAPISAASSPLAPRPRVVFCGRAPADELLRLHNEGEIHQTVDAPASAQWLRIAVRRGCEDFALHTELRRMNLELSRAYLRDRSRASASGSGDKGVLAQMVLKSPAIRRTLDLLQMVAPHDAHVLLQGETGTGKEMFARALHDLSSRAGGPFVAIDCGALPDTLLESELFGHVEGAFTGATRARPGLFQVAESGTLFLDEIENTTPSLQAKLLRAIETGEVRPVGGSSARRVDVRVVTASNRDLRSEVSRGTFRSDLFYRLNTFPIDVPALRSRPEDIVPLARFFAERFAAKIDRPLGPFTAAAETLLQAYAWPGNVRELRNVVERAALLTAPHQALDVGVLPQVVVEATPAESGATGALEMQVETLERQLITDALRRHGGIARRAAKDLGVSPVTLGRKMKRYGIQGSGAS